MQKAMVGLLRKSDTIKLVNRTINKVGINTNLGAGFCDSAELITVA